MMAHATDTNARRIMVLLFAIVAALGSGCGNGFYQGSGDGFGSALASRLLDQMGGPGTELLLYTSCESFDDRPRSRCIGVRSAEIEAFFDGKSLIFDFSNAPTDGTIAETGFEGYVLSLTERSELPTIVDAIVDEEDSNVDAGNVDVEIEDRSVSINFEGLRYDDATFVKVDLVFEGA